MYGERRAAQQPNLDCLAPIITVNEHPNYHTLQEGSSYYHEETHQQIAQRSQSVEFASTSWQLRRRSKKPREERAEDICQQILEKVLE